MYLLSVGNFINHIQLSTYEKRYDSPILFTYDELEIEVARRSGSYKDQTGNLRSSIGYIIAKDGEVVTENFKEGDKGTDKTTGKYKGRRLAEEVSLSYTGGYVLVGVAGMEYAAAVEAKGYEVVSGANTQCEKYLRDTLKSIFSKI